jgi:hypothetical protein
VSDSLSKKARWLFPKKQKFRKKSKNLIPFFAGTTNCHSSINEDFISDEDTLSPLN